MNFLIVPVAEASVITFMKSINRVIINPIIFFLFACAMVYFLYGVAKYLLSPDNEEVRKNSKSIMLWGVVGLFIMVAVFGIMNLILGTLGETKIKIQNNGDYEVVDYNLSGGQVNSQINQGVLGNGGTTPTSSNSNLSTSSNSNLSTNLNPDRETGDIDFGNHNLPAPESGSFTTSPFTTEYLRVPLCWQKDVYGKGTTEYKALQDVAKVAKSTFSSETGVTDSRYPIAFNTKTFYDKSGKLYYVWWDVRAPVQRADMSECNLVVIPPATELPAPTHRSARPNQLAGTYVSDNTTYRIVDSGVEDYLQAAKNRAMDNALIEVAKLKGLRSTAAVGNAIILEEKSFTNTSTAQYEVWIAIEVKK